MRTHTTGLHTEAYVCARILVPKNPNLSFLLLFLCFFYIICLYLVTFYVFLVSVSLFKCLFVLNIIRLGFSLIFLCFTNMHITWLCIDAMGDVMQWGKSRIHMNMHFDDEYVCFMLACMSRCLGYIQCLIPCCHAYACCHDLFATLDDMYDKSMLGFVMLWDAMIDVC